ncbi:MAG: hypothetical protein L6R36_008575 [Xanthoria steineri]|nr:MAG: hypothetical protein L6R36_008575 [Xanthoria steineri]
MRSSSSTSVTCPPTSAESGPPWGWGGRSFAEVTTAQKPVAAEGVPSDNNSLEKRNANTFIANSWLTGPSWPLNGEIDIVEGVNLQSTNKITLHSDPGCIIKGKDCQGSQGCSIDAGPYGSGWGTPTAIFPSSSSCNTDTYFRNQQIVFDTTFCGTSKADPHRLFSVLLTGTRAGIWAGKVWASDPQCSSLAPTCQEYVQNNPKAFADAYWSINALKVYTSGDGPTSSGSAGSTSGSTGNTDTTDTTDTTNKETSSRRVGEGGLATIANPQLPSTINPQASTPTTNPAAEGRTGGGQTWGSGRGDRGGRGGRGGGRKEKRKLRLGGRHV